MKKMSGLSPSIRQPTLFDLLASDSLLLTVRPALKKALHSLAYLHPRGLEWVHRWVDEVALVCEVILHYHFLKKYGGSFAENFYGFRRYQASKDESLGSFAVFRSIAIVAILPYLKKKLADLFDLITRMESDGELEGTPYAKHAKSFLAVYPILLACTQSASFIYQLLYTLGQTKFNDPLDHLAGFHMAFPPPEPVKAPSSSRPSDSLIKSSLNGLIHLSGRLASHSFTLGLFAAQLLDVFNEQNGRHGIRSGFSATSSLGDMDLLKRLGAISAPKMAAAMSPANVAAVMRPANMAGLRKAPTGNSIGAAGGGSKGLSTVGQATFSTSESLCPLCSSTRQNEVALSVSGFVFCHACIVAHLRVHGSCPVTKLPADSRNLVRLFPDA